MQPETPRTQVAIAATRPENGAHKVSGHRELLLPVGNCDRGFICNVGDRHSSHPEDGSHTEKRMLGVPTTAHRSGVSGALALKPENNGSWTDQRKQKDWCCDGSHTENPM